MNRVIYTEMLGGYAKILKRPSERLSFEELAQKGAVGIIRNVYISHQSYDEEPVSFYTIEFQGGQLVDISAEFIGLVKDNEAMEIRGEP